MPVSHTLAEACALQVLLVVVTVIITIIVFLFIIIIIIIITPARWFNVHQHWFVRIGAWVWVCVCVSRITQKVMNGYKGLIQSFMILFMNANQLTLQWRVYCSSILLHGRVVTVDQQKKIKNKK